MTANVANRATESADLQWLQELLGSESAATPVRYLARPSATEPRLLLPTEPAAAASAAMRRLHGDRGWRGNAELVAGRLIGRTGLLRFAPGESILLPPFELVDYLANRLGEPNLTAAVTLGPPRRNRKPVLQLLRPDGCVAGFAKVGWSDLTRDLVTTEATVLRRVAGFLPESVVAPAVISVEHWRNLIVSVCAELRPPSGPSFSGPDPGRVAEIVSRIDRGRRLVRDLPLIIEGLGGPLGEAIDLSRLLELHGSVELTTGLWHGDFTPWNMVGRSQRTYIWDWEFAGWHRPVGFDLLHHHFERLRRKPGVKPEAALTALLDQAEHILAGSRANPGPAALVAVIDVYLCELLARELTLNGQRWSGGDMALIGPILVDVLRRRLA